MSPNLSVEKCKSARRAFSPKPSRQSKHVLRRHTLVCNTGAQHREGISDLQIDYFRFPNGSAM
jgi:hypothetical protein